METSEFYATLNNLPQCYTWGMEDTEITVTKTRGVARGTSFNPITAVAHRMGFGMFSNNKKETLKAGTALGLPRTFTSNVYDAVRSTTNRGNAQVVRGRILEAISN